LLSYLSEAALAAAEKAGGEAVIPFRDKPGVVTSKQTTIGGIPNHFEVVFSSEEDALMAGDIAKSVLLEAWYRVADAVWEKYIEPVADKGNGTEEIWKRQVKNFWEIGWVVGLPRSESVTISHLAAARKRLRNTSAQIEPGIKCSLMGTMQEISGFYGPGEREKQKEFWDDVEQNASSLDFKDDKGERLCAVAVIKRLFPRVIQEAVGKDICKELTGQESWPSTAYFAALPWLKKIADKGAVFDAEEYAKAARKLGYSGSERGSNGLRGEWSHLDGPAWFISSMRREKDGNNRHNALELLNKLYEKVSSKPVPYYALILMDGDSMGKLIASMKNAGSRSDNFSKNLGEFAKSVQGIVARLDGKAIYAGGDDVMAVLPAKHALDATEKLARKYSSCFNNDSKATLSGAIVFAHRKFPLRQVLREAHHLLDDVAKNGTGRDALAIGVIQGGGLNAVWSAPWKAVRGGDVEKGFGELNKVIDLFSSAPKDKQIPRFNASFLYMLRNRFSKLLDEPLGAPGSFGRIGFESDLLTDIANAEYRRRMRMEERKRLSPMETKKIVEPLIALSRRWFRVSEEEVKSYDDTFNFDGWRVARFLKQIKDGKVDDHE
jgi:CRISPR-associated protein Cmr2